MLKSEKTFPWQSDLNYQFLIFPNTNLYLHWSDSAKLIHVLQGMVKKNHFIVDRLFQDLSGNKEKFFWIKTDNSNVKMSIDELYLFVINHLKNGKWEDQLFNSQLVSFVSPAGPYQTVTPIEIINRDMLSKYIYLNLIKNKLPFRGFRIQTKGKVLCEFGDQMSQKCYFSLDQITKTGLILSTSDDLFVSRLGKNELIKVNIRSQLINRLLENPHYFDGVRANDLFYTSNPLDYFYIEQSKIIKSLSFESGVHGKIFLFMRYTDMQEGQMGYVCKELIETVSEAVFKAVG